MGYAGYVPAKYAVQLTGKELVLKKVQNEASYELLAKVIRNVVVNPTDDKFRRLRLSNAKIAAALTNVPNAVEALLALGWVRDTEDEDFVFCPKSSKLSMAEVRMIEDARVAYLKDLRASKRSAASREAAAAKGGDAARIAAQLAADRVERAAAGPVERGSSAQALPNAGLVTAGDLGLNSGGCCD